MGESEQLGVKPQESLDQGRRVYLLQALSARASASALNPGSSHQRGELPARTVVFTTVKHWPRKPRRLSPAIDTMPRGLWKQNKDEELTFPQRFLRTGLALRLWVRSLIPLHTNPVPCLYCHSRAQSVLRCSTEPNLGTQPEAAGVLSASTNSPLPMFNEDKDGIEYGIPITQPCYQLGF